MGDLQRIHPFPDLESAAAGSPVPHPAAPLLPFSAASSSEKGDPATVPTPPQPPRRRLVYCLCASLLLLVLLIGLLAAAFFLVFRPKLPHYSISGLHVSNFTLSSNNTLSTALVVNVTARNPNNRIGIYYEGGSLLSVWYHVATELCEGYLPAFYHDHRNTTVIAVALSGMTPNATAIARELQRSKGGGGVALVIRGKVKVGVKIGKLRFRKRKVISVRCEMIVDSLNPSDDKINIKSSSCKIHL